MIFFQYLEKLCGIHLFSLFECPKHDVLGCPSLIRYGSLDLVIIVSAHGAQSAATAYVLVKLILKINERIVGLEVELDVSQDRRHHIGSHLLGLGLNNDSFETLGPMIFYC